MAGEEASEKNGSTLWGTHKGICFSCKQVSSVLKELNLKCHYKTDHNSYDQFKGFFCLVQPSVI